MNELPFNFEDDLRDRERELYEETRKNQGPSMRSLDLTNFLPGVSDQLYPCPCGKFLTMGGVPCRECRGER